MVKDLDNAVRAGGDAGLPQPCVRFAKQQYEQISRAGHGNLDFGVVFRELKQRG